MLYLDDPERRCAAALCRLDHHIVLSNGLKKKVMDKINHPQNWPKQPSSNIVWKKVLRIVNQVAKSDNNEMTRAQLGEVASGAIAIWLVYSTKHSTLYFQIPKTLYNQTGMTVGWKTEFETIHRDLETFLTDNPAGYDYGHVSSIGLNGSGDIPEEANEEDEYGANEANEAYEGGEAYADGAGQGSPNNGEDSSNTVHHYSHERFHPIERKRGYGPNDDYDGDNDSHRRKRRPVQSPIPEDCLGCKLKVAEIEVYDSELKMYKGLYKEEKRKSANGGDTGAKDREIEDLKRQLGEANAQLGVQSDQLNRIQDILLEDDRVDRRPVSKSNTTPTEGNFGPRRPTR